MKECVHDELDITEGINAGQARNIARNYEKIHDMSSVWRHIAGAAKQGKTRMHIKLLDVERVILKNRGYILTLVSHEDASSEPRLTEVDWSNAV